MNKERIIAELNSAKEKNPGVDIINPGELAPADTAENLAVLLNSMYVEHGVTKDVKKLTADIEAGNVKTWFAKKDNKFIATASLIKDGNSWEGGRSVSIDRGKGSGKLLMLTRTLFHLNNHPNETLFGEVRVADAFRGIPSGEATQHIWFDIAGIAPHALAPLFGHGAPHRNETFALVASNVKDSKTISERLNVAISGRDLTGSPTRLKVNTDAPFVRITPDANGGDAEDIIENATHRGVVSLFSVETTDQNMGLVGALLGNPSVLICGVGRDLGVNGKPIALFTTFSPFIDIAPSKISDDLPRILREDMQSIADKFTQRGNKNMNITPMGY